jgi:hypothetical protein
MSLLTALTYILARHRKVSGMSEVGKHLAVDGPWLASGLEGLGALREQQPEIGWGSSVQGTGKGNRTSTFAHRQSHRVRCCYLVVVTLSFF